VSRFIPTTDQGRALLLGLVLISVGLAVGLPPLALWGPGAALVVPGAIFLFLTFFATAPEGDDR
jgi:hypothetical protein